MRILFLIFFFVSIFAKEKSPFIERHISFDSRGNVTIDGDSLSLHNLIKDVASVARRNIIFKGINDKNLNLMLNSISLSQAFDSLVAAGGWCYHDYDGVVFISNCADIELLSKKNEVLSNIFNISLSFIKAKDFVKQITSKTDLKEVRIISTDGKLNTIKLSCSYKDYKEIQKLKKLLDIPPKQISIRAYLVSVDEDYLTNLGIKFQPDAGSNQKKSNVLNLFSRNVGLVRAQLKILEQNGHAHIISAPELVTTSGKSAFIETGDEIPYFEPDTNGRSAVVFKKAVLSLKFIPDVIGANMVKMHISISQDQPGQSYAGVMAIKTRRVDTDAIVKSGQSLVLGGIFERHKAKVEAGLPLFKSLPFFGIFFRHKEEIIKKRQLLIFITPQIIL
ncbi:MAG: hypothetical protein VX335_04645 [Pseudomonadota bacterium]|nr:hypothetical protein [Pseudomonadota bacterium]